MAIRFTSYESYKQMLASKDGDVSSSATFLGILAPAAPVHTIGVLLRLSDWHPSRPALTTAAFDGNC